MNQLSTISDTQTNLLSSVKKIYIKRKVLKQQPVHYGSSIFNQSQIKSIEPLQELKQNQTLTTAVDNTVTLHTNHDEASFFAAKDAVQEKPQLFPRLNRVLQSKLKSKSSIQSQQYKGRQKTSSLKNCVPYYVQLQETAVKRVHKKHNQYKRAWLDASYRRQKSLVERSLNRAASSIENINKEAAQRKNASQLSLILRNNIAQKTFIFPGRLKSQIAGLKGKGGKAIPIFQEMYMVEQVYKHNKGKKQMRKQM